MREFFILLADSSRKDLQRIESQEIGNRNIRPLWKCERIDPQSISTIRLFANGNPPADLLSNSHGFLIASRKLVSLLQNVVPESDMQLLDAPVFSESTGNRIDGYYLINPLKKIAALTTDCAAGRMIVDQFAIEESKVDTTIQLFRLAESISLVIITDSVLQRLSNQGLQGVMVMRVKTWSQGKAVSEWA